MNSLKNFYLVIASIFFCTVLFELFLYFDDYHPNYKQHEFILSQNTHLVNDSPTEFFNDTRKNKTVFIGDSFTVNKVCAYKKKDFVSLLKNKYSDEKTSIYNFAIGGTGIAEYAAVTSKISDHVDNIIVVLYYNDIFFDKSACESIIYLNKLGFRKVPFCDKIIETNIDTSNDTKLKALDNFFENNFFSYRLIKEALVNMPYVSDLFARSSWKDLYLDYSSVENKLFIDLLKFIKKTSNDKNISTSFVYFPDVTYLSEDNLRLEAWNNFILHANQQGIKINDPWTFFIENASKTNLTWSYVDDHPNCEANYLMYEYLSDSIVF